VGGGIDFTHSSNACSACGELTPKYSAKPAPDQIGSWWVAKYRVKSLTPHSSLARKHVINSPHDPLGPLNASLNQPVSPWAALRPAKQVICALHVQRSQNCRHDSD
jgi:hypothetical protein